MSNKPYYRGSSTYKTLVSNELTRMFGQHILLRNSMRNMEYGIISDIRASTYAIVASQQMLAETFHDGFNSVSNTLEAGFEMFSSRLSTLESSITEIGEKICNKLDEIHDIVNNPLLTQSRELYRRALTNYNKGYYEEALADCKAAVEKNKTDYISWNLLGQIFLFGAGKFSNVINLDYAEKAFTNAAKYIDSDLGKSDEANQLGSEIYYYLGYTKLLLSNDYLVENKIDDSNQKLAEAENHSGRAYQLSNENILAAYDQAKELHFLEKDDESLAILEEIFKKEPVFAVKASNDKNFESIWNRIDNLIKKLNDEITKEIQERCDEIIFKATEEINSLKKQIENLDCPTKEEFEIARSEKKLRNPQIEYPFPEKLLRECDAKLISIESEFNSNPIGKKDFLSLIKILEEVEKTKESYLSSAFQPLRDSFKAMQKEFSDFPEIRKYAMSTYEDNAQLKELKEQNFEMYTGVCHHYNYLLNKGIIKKGEGRLINRLNNPIVENDNGCYVATAIYGSYDCPQVWTLRRFRDYKLAQTWCGRIFIRLYYATSPTIVKYFGETLWFKTLLRRKLDCMVKKLQSHGLKNTPYKDKVWQKRRKHKSK